VANVAKPPDVVPILWFIGDVVSMYTVIRPANLARLSLNAALADCVVQPILRHRLFGMTQTIFTGQFCVLLRVFFLPRIR
jgi:hypothetical protein